MSNSKVVSKLSDINWTNISCNEVLSEGFIREFQDKVNWLNIGAHQKLSEEFIREFQDKVDWIGISTYQKLSEEFIREFQDKVSWDYISVYQKLSEEFIREFQDKVDWSCISTYQKLSEEFIREFQDKVNWINISKHQKLSEGFRKEFNLQIPENSWMYWTVNQKKEYIQANHPEYEVIENKLYAYKTVRSNGCSAFNFQYHYEVGKEYECHADCNPNNPNSFGLSAWTKGKAIEHHNKGKLFKVEIGLEDLACITKKGNIRASKIKISEEIPQ